MKNDYRTIYIAEAFKEYDLEAAVPQSTSLKPLVDLGLLEDMGQGCSKQMTRFIAEKAPYLSHPEYAAISAYTALPHQHISFLANLVFLAINELAQGLGGDDARDDYFPCLVDTIADYAKALDRMPALKPLLEAIFAPGSPYYGEDADEMFAEYLV